ncbi:hypothetical protein [Bradyrhizobium sp. USDA 3364]
MAAPNPPEPITTTSALLIMMQCSKYVDRNRIIETYYAVQELTIVILPARAWTCGAKGQGRG